MGPGDGDDRSSPVDSGAQTADHSDGRPAHDPAARNLLDPDGELARLAGDCVHCGFCLPACPTYQLWGEEMDSPRGRIHLITQILTDGKGGAATAGHLDRCLGCMACMPACPSGVQYGRLIEAARVWAEKPELAGTAGQADSAPLPPRSRREQAGRSLIFATFPYPARLRALLAPLRIAQRTGLDRLAVRSGLLGKLAPEAVAALSVAPHPAGRPPRLPGRVPAGGQRRAVVGMLTGCVQQVFFPQVNVATARVLSAEGCDVVIPPAQGCCGALSLHGGRRSQAAGFAASTIAEFERAGVDVVIVNAAGCGSAMKEYSRLLAGDAQWARRAEAFSAKVRDFSEFLAELGPVAARSELRMTVAYQDACHLSQAQRITRQPRDLLNGIPGLVTRELGDGGGCCGSAGIYNLVQPQTAAELGARKASAVLATGAELVVSANPGCAMQLARGLREAGHPLPVAHIAEVLDASIRGLAPESAFHSQRRSKSE